MYPIETEIIFILMSGSDGYKFTLSVSSAKKMNIVSRMCPGGCMQLLKRPSRDVLCAFYWYLYFRICGCAALCYGSASSPVNGI